MYSYGPLHMAVQKQGDHLEPTYSSSVRIQGVALGTYRKQWTIGWGGERGLGISMLMAGQDEMMIITDNFSVAKYFCCQAFLFSFSPSLFIIISLFLTFFWILLFLSIVIVHPYSSIDTTAAWKKLHFILSVRSDFHMIDSLSIAVHAFISHVSMHYLDAN